VQVRLEPDHTPIKAVLFDLDGTLYDQRRMRARMAVELARFAAAHPMKAFSTSRALTAYRRAQETVRRRQCSQPAPFEQLDVAARHARMTTEQVARTVDEWMIERPLRHLPGCSFTGLVPVLEFLATRDAFIGVLSDYPAKAKLEALGIAHHFSLVLCAGDQKVGVFKPDPRGYHVACEHWQLRAEQVLFVGDRVDVDAAGARAAGMPCVIIGAERAATERGGYLCVPSLERLLRVLDPAGSDDRR
jgi:phosphoglycolate phosphatase/putative hydrolase of the HAD superfamily